MKASLHIDIPCPIDDVFDAACNHVVEWSKTCVEDEVLEDRDGVGTRFRMVTEDNGRRMDFEGEVTAWDPPTHSAVFMTGKYFHLDVGYDLEPIEAGTRLTQNTNVIPQGFMRVMFFLFGWLMKRANCEAQDNELESLREFCIERAKG